MTQSLYRVRAAVLPEDEKSVRDIWIDAFPGSDALPRRLRGLYASCPAGPPLLLLLIHAPTGQAVGVSGVIPRRTILNGEEVIAGQVVDVVVRRAHRSLGPALQLQRAVMQQGASISRFLYGFPNQNAIGVMKRVGYRESGTIARFALVVRHQRYLRRLVPGPLAVSAAPLVDALASCAAWLRRALFKPYRRTWLSMDDERIDHLWEESSKSGIVASRRDRAHLRWRFASGESQRFRLLGLLDSNDKLEAWFVCERENLTFSVHDFWCRSGPGVINRAMADELFFAAREEDCDSVSVEVGGAPVFSRAWQKAGYTLRAKRPMLAYWPEKVIPPALEDVYLTAGDEDA